MTKARLVRDQIEFAKIIGKSPDSVIEWAMSELHMNRALAKAYVKNNWPKTRDPSHNNALLIKSIRSAITESIDLKINSLMLQSSDLAGHNNRRIGDC